MKFNKEQFNKEVSDYRNLKLSEEAKLRIRSSIENHMNAHPIQMPSPYINYFHFSYKMAFVSLALVLSLSLGTAYASQSSLPGDLLYPIKTNITEPVIKLSKVSVEAKEEFELKLADERIKEIKKLTESGRLTEDNLDKNLSLFEKHIEEKRKEREQNKKDKQEFRKIEKKKEDVTQESKSEAGFNTTTHLSSPDEEDEIETELDERIDMYRDVMLSKPELRDLYEHKAKERLDKKRRHFSNKEYIEDMSKTTQDQETVSHEEDNSKTEMAPSEINMEHETELELENQKRENRGRDRKENDLKIENKVDLLFR